ncbi:MAG: pantoate--beta-alanine ligase [Armatimonadota bacterium]|jgi:pantoate--beta-alanine ligase
MQVLVLDTVSAMTHWRRSRSADTCVGLAPTMGALHEGHLSLIRGAVADCDATVVSLFVNPTQFGPGEDLERYPRDFEGDLEAAAREGVDAVFAPRAVEMYPEQHATHVEVERLTEGLCGRFRPGHFRGVTTIVLKLLNIARPHRAYFGEKDYQQLTVIRRMVADMNLDCEIVGMPTVREADGLAMSSRNAHLSPEQRQAALVLPRSLTKARQLVESGERSAARVLQAAEKLFADEARVSLQYVEVVDPDTLVPVERCDGDVVIAAACLVGDTRLIDNQIVRLRRRR